MISNKLRLISAVIFIVFANSSFVSSLNFEYKTNRPPFHTLLYYETLKISDFSHATFGNVKIVTFDSYNRQFKLRLTPDYSAIHPNIKVYALDADLTKTANNLNFAEILLTGYDGLSGPQHSNVYLTILEDRRLFAKIRVFETTYFIEPSDIHFNSPDLDFDMIIFRNEDVNRTHFSLRNVSPTDGVNVPYKHRALHNRSQSDQLSRTARNLSPQNTHCSLLMVADFEFFRTVGRNSVASTVQYIAGLVQRSNFYFERTSWTLGVDQSISNLGLQIQEIQVHVNFTQSMSNRPRHYNEDYPFNSNALLDAFTYNEDNQFCLRHLLTYRDFTGLIGLAYTDTLCFQPVGTSFEGLNIYYGSSFSTAKNFGTTLVVQLLEITFTHEIGHNWGTSHDPETDECAPSNSAGGRFIMYPFAVDGRFNNNFFFSPCSRRSIGVGFLELNPNCFSPLSGSFCGNSQVEDGEECDAGIEGKSGNDVCCDENCNLRPGSLCSFLNDPCCEQSCEFSNNNIICAVSSQNSCKNESFCTGSSAGCPARGISSDSTTCLGNGICKAGNCLPYCSRIENATTCICTAPADYCKFCCQLPNQTCQPMQQIIDGMNVTYVPNGLPCLLGVCQNQMCQKVSQDIITRIGDLFSLLTIDKAALILRDNIVIVIVILSLLVWTPPSIALGIWDYRMRKEAEKKGRPANLKPEVTSATPPHGRFKRKSDVSLSSTPLVV